MLVSVQPPDLLQEQGLRVARNGRACASPEHVPEPWHHGRLRGAGAAATDRRLRLEPGGGGDRRPGAATAAVTACAPAGEQGAFAEVDRRIDGYALPVDEAGRRFVVVSTQGRGDEAALRAALAAETDYIAFVGSRRRRRR